MIFDSKEIMSVPFLTMEASVGHAEEVFRKHALFSLPVLDADGAFAGILCLKKVFLAATEKDPEPTLWQRQALERRPIPRRPSAHPEMPTTPILPEPQWAVTWQSLVSILILPLRQI